MSKGFQGDYEIEKSDFKYPIIHHESVGRDQRMGESKLKAKK